MKNPFKRPEMMIGWDEAVEAYRQKAAPIWRDGKPDKGNAWGSRFWLGYNGITTGLGNYAAHKGAKDTTGYIFYRAGQDIAKTEKR